MKDRLITTRHGYKCSDKNRLCFAGVLLFLVGWHIDPTLTLAQAIETQVLSLDIRSGQVVNDKRLIKVDQGDGIELLWTTDQDVELHLHGYDIHLVVKPDRPGSMIFNANLTGRFPVGIHRKGGHGNIVYLEVHPR